MQTVACFGDSLIYGFPFGPRTSWLAEAEKVTGDKFLNYGVCGDCTDDILFRLKTIPLPAHIKHILFLALISFFIATTNLSDTIPKSGIVKIPAIPMMI